MASFVPTTLFDSFSRTSASSWGTMDSGASWNTTDSDFTVSNGVGQMFVAAGGNQKNTYVNFGSLGIADQDTSEVLTLMRIPAVSGNEPSSDAGPILNRTANNTFYFASLQMAANRIVIGAYVGGSRYELDAITLSLSTSKKYWVRFQRGSTTLRLKVWEHLTPEPASWLVVSGLYKGNNAPAAGDIGMFRLSGGVAYTTNVYAFYGYTLEDNQDYKPVFDNFARSTVSGFGWSQSNHLWEGDVVYDPDVYKYPIQGTVAGGLGTITTTSNEDYTGWLGPSSSTPIELLATVQTNSNNGTAWLDLGILGTKTVSASGGSIWNGYMIEFKSAATTIRLRKRVNESTSNLASAVIPQIVANTPYKIRFQNIANVLRAKIWLASAAEPGTWNITYTDTTSPITSGRLWIHATQDVDSPKTVSIDQISYDLPDPAGSTLPTTTGTLTLGSSTDTTLSLNASFSNDSDGDNSILIEYKRSTESTWTTFGGTRTRTASNYAFTLTGLTKGTLYNVRVTFSDPDGVFSTNPLTASFTTATLGITTAPPYVTALDTSSVSLRADPTDDSNHNATLTVEYRTTSDNVQIVVDSFDGSSGTVLDNRQAEIGGTWIKHPSYANSIKIGNRGRVYVEAPAFGESVLYYNNVTPPQAEYTVSGYLYVPTDVGDFFLCGRLDPAVLTTYYAGYYRQDDFNSFWRLGKLVNGVLTVLASVPATVNVNEAYLMELELRSDYKALRVNGTEVCRSTDNTITATGKPGMWAQGLGDTFPTTEFGQVNLDDFAVTYRTVSGSWTNAGTMTLVSGPNYFIKTVSGLSAGTGYEFRVTYADSNGVYGGNPLSTTAMTEGQGIKMLSIVPTPSMSTSIIEVFYDFDTNNNSDMAIQYRSTFDKTWKTLSPNSIKVDRGNKRFIGLLSGLKPSTTYEVKAIATDPNGFVHGSETTLRTTFATQAYIEDSTRQSKHYLWKVYDTDHDYLTTWHDAGEPEFAWHENGGVTDLSVTLPRRFNSINDPKSGIGFLNRVDIWCVDPASDGMGENMVLDPEFALGGWALGPNTVFMTAGGPDDSHCARIIAPTSAVNVTRSSPIYVFTGQPPNTNVVGEFKDASAMHDVDTSNVFVSKSRVKKAPPVPVFVTAMARAVTGKVRMYVEAYAPDEAGIDDVKIDQSDDFGETVGTDWQQIQCEYVPPPETTYLRVAFENDGAGTMYFDKCYMRQKEMLIYRGRIESFTPKISQEGENVVVNVLGLVSQLSDDYIEFLQYVAIQPTKDLINARENLGPADPAEMMRNVIDMARTQNKKCELYYTDASIKSTGELQEYTFRDQQLRACFDKIRDLCPPNWHYYIEPDGKVVLRGPEHGKEHFLRIGVEVMEFSVEKSITNLKNFVHVKGRQDEDGNEPDGHGSIHYFAFDQKSIDKYGKRMLYIRDAQITTPDTAKTMGEGRLEEMNREEQRIECNVPDEKSINFAVESLRGYNIEEFRPGDSIRFINPIGQPNLTYWDSLVFNKDPWDYSSTLFVLPDAVPVKTVQYHGRYAVLELSERPPKSTSQFGRLYKMLQLQDSNNSGE